MYDSGGTHAFVYFFNFAIMVNLYNSNWDNVHKKQFKLWLCSGIGHRGSPRACSHYSHGY